MTTHQIIFLILISIFILFIIYNDNKHSCIDYLENNLKSCKLIDGYYNLLFEKQCRFCKKKFGEHKVKHKKLNI